MKSTVHTENKKNDNLANSSMKKRTSYNIEFDNFL